jgi:hypothetical protein
MREAYRSLWNVPGQERGAEAHKESIALSTLWQAGTIQWEEMSARTYDPSQTAGERRSDFVGIICYLQMQFEFMRSITLLPPKNLDEKDTSDRAYVSFCQLSPPAEPVIYLRRNQSCKPDMRKTKIISSLSAYATSSRAQEHFIYQTSGRYKTLDSLCTPC